nr:HAD family hydrolase [uncultured Cellulosilyticum sp.]
MNKKVIFCDIDGTLVNHHGVMPATTKEAIRKARENGHLVFLCTGRSKVEVVGEAAKLEVDGRICSAGGYVEVQGKVIRQEFMPVETIKHLVSFLDANEIHFCLEAIDKTYVSRHTRKFFTERMATNIAAHPEDKEQIEAHMQGLIDHMVEGADLVRDDICKVLFFGSRLSIEALKEEFKEIIVLPNSMEFWGGNSGEMMIPNVHKASGIEYVLAHLGLNKEDTVGYGDSLNDMEMLQFVDLGIAMGNAIEALKEVADEITDSVEENGIYNSFKKHNFIG